MPARAQHLIAVAMGVAFYLCRDPVGLLRHASPGASLTRKPLGPSRE